VNSEVSDRTEKSAPKLQRLLFVLLVGFVPYVGGFIIFRTRDIGVLGFVGVLICAPASYAAYSVRSLGDPVTAKQRIIADPFLYGFAYAFTAVVIRYLFLG
jgi:hypothetical protein